MNVPGCRTGDRAMRLTALKPSVWSADLREAGADVLKGAAEVADPAGAGEPARGGRGLEVEAGRGRQALARLDARHHAGRTVLASVEVMVDCSRASATLAETAKSKKVVG